MELQDEGALSDALKKHKEHMGTRYIELVAATKADLVAAVQQNRMILGHANRKQWMAAQGLRGGPPMMMGGPPMPGPYPYPPMGGRGYATMYPGPRGPMPMPPYGPRGYGAGRRGMGAGELADMFQGAGASRHGAVEACTAWLHL